VKAKSAVLLSVAALAAGCASPSVVTVQVPDAIKPGANEALAMVVPAKGVQIYECRADKWVFVGPEAELFNTAGKPIGKHYAGPHWEAADGSKVVATVKGRADAPQAGDIPWLLLAARSVGKEGSFSRVTSIQRVATAGGVAPAGGCDRAGTRANVGYTADYYFFTAK
jgi:hypothetical protein